MQVTVEFPFGNRIVEHVKRNKTKYAVGATIVVAGITCVIVRGRTTTLAYGGVDGSETITNRPFNFLFCSKQKQTIVNVLERDGRGHPGYLTMCDETLEVWSSQAQAAEDAEVDPIYMSKHLRGELPDIKGKHYRRIAA